MLKTLCFLDSFFSIYFFQSSSKPYLPCGSKGPEKISSLLSVGLEVVRPSSRIGLLGLETTDWDGCKAVAGPTVANELGLVPSKVVLGSLANNGLELVDASASGCFGEVGSPARKAVLLADGSRVGKSLSRRTFCPL